MWGEVGRKTSGKSYKYFYTSRQICKNLKNNILAQKLVGHNLKTLSSLQWCFLAPFLFAFQQLNTQHRHLIEICYGDFLFLYCVTTK